MTLFEFAETADDGEMDHWIYRASDDEFNFIKLGNLDNYPIIYSQRHLDMGYTNNVPIEVARMYFQFVALATGEQV